jgi:hypothetical protein
MTFFLGHYGRIKLSRKSKLAIETFVAPADINTTLNRFSFDEAVDNIYTGDQIVITTEDARKLDFIPASSWEDGSNVTQNEFVAYCNVNSIGGIRLFNNFAAAINNDRTQEYALESFTGAPLPVTVRLYGATERLLGDVTGYTFNTDRESLDTTVMSDKFKSLYSAGILSGSGTIDCLFDATSSGLSENSLLMLQLIMRTDVGSDFKCYLQLNESEAGDETPSVYYEFDAMIIKTGIEVRADQVITCAIDFATTGEIRLVVGQPSGYLLKEDTDRIRLQQGLDFLLTEVTD